MKKLYTTLLSTLFVGSAFAQGLSNERMVVTDNLGQKTSYAVDRIKQISFPVAAGEAKAEVSVSQVTAEKVTFVVTRNEYAESFKLDIMPKLRANAMSDDQLAAYVDNNNKTVYYQDFTAGDVSLESFQAKAMTEYQAITVGFDEYGTPCGVCRADFTTLPAVLVGNPKVEHSDLTIAPREFSVTTTANADVKGYATLAGEKGILMDQYYGWGAMMGFSNFSDLVKGWGYQHTPGDNGWEPATDSWKQMSPGTDYQIFIQGWDAKDNYLPCDTINLTTKVLGGVGAATVDMTLGDYKLQDWNGEQLYSQFITFTPNDQSSCYRFNVVKAELYDKDAEGYQNDLKQDPPMPMSNWFFYEPVTTDFQIDPETEVVAIAAAKNANKEWGVVSVKRFTTPAATATPEVPAERPVAAPAKVKKVQTESGKIMQRERHSFTVPFQQGYLPNFTKYNAGVKMVQSK